MQAIDGPQCTSDIPYFHALLPTDSTTGLGILRHVPARETVSLPTGASPSGPRSPFHAHERDRATRFSSTRTRAARDRRQRSMPMTGSYWKRSSGATMGADASCPDWIHTETTNRAWTLVGTANPELLFFLVTETPRLLGDARQQTGIVDGICSDHALLESAPHTSSTTRVSDGRVLGLRHKQTRCVARTNDHWQRVLSIFAEIPCEAPRPTVMMVHPVSKLKLLSLFRSSSFAVM